MLVTRMMLSWRRAASTTASSPTTEPVWARAACCPAGLEPTFRATIGFFFRFGRLGRAPPRVVPDHRAGVGQGRLLSGRAGADLQGHDRLAGPVRLLGHLGEAGR